MVGRPASSSSAKRTTASRISEPFRDPVPNDAPNDAPDDAVAAGFGDPVTDVVVAAGFGDPVTDVAVPNGAVAVGFGVLVPNDALNDAVAAGFGNPETNGADNPMPAAAAKAGEIGKRLTFGFLRDNLLRTDFMAVPTACKVPGVCTPRHVAASFFNPRKASVASPAPVAVSPKPVAVADVYLTMSLIDQDDISGARLRLLSRPDRVFATVANTLPGSP